VFPGVFCPSTTKDSNVVAHCDTSAIDANTIWDRSANVPNSPVSTADRVTNIPPAMELHASVRQISRGLCAKTQWIPWPDASIHRRVLTVECVTNRTERFSASVRQDLAVPGGQTMSTIVLIHRFVSTGAFASTESTISPAPATGNLFSLFSLAIVDCCCCCAVTKEKGVKQRSIIVYWMPAKMAGLVSIVTADLAMCLRI
jgi:hypothetical protein